MFLDETIPRTGTYPERNRMIEYSSNLAHIRRRIANCKHKNTKIIETLTTEDDNGTVLDGSRDLVCLDCPYRKALE